MARTTPRTTKKRPRAGPGSNAYRKVKKLSLSIIGAGRLGTALAIAMTRAGHSIELIVAKHLSSARRAVRLSGAQAVAASVEQFRRMAADEPLIPKDLVLIATPDDAISSVAGDLAQIMNQGRLRRLTATPVTLHTSGALSSDILSGLRMHGLSVGSLHPLLSISDPRAGAASLAGAYFSVQGDARAVRLSRRIVSELGGQTFSIAAQRKALYHAAALMASPNMTALFDIALEMLSRCGLTPDRARKVLLPLVKSTLDNLATQTPARALTGTFKRGDVATVRRHLEAISAEHLSDALEAYVLLGRRSMELAPHRPADDKLIEETLRDALNRDRPSVDPV